MVRRTLSILLLLATIGHASDIITLHLSTEQDVQTAKTIFTGAAAVVDSLFVVQADYGQETALRQAGISYATVIPGASITSYSLVGPGHRAMAMGGKFTAKPGFVAVGASRYLVVSNDAALSDLLRRRAAWAMPLTGRPIPFRVIAPAVGLPVAPQALFPTDSIADRVSKDSLFAYNKRLEDFYTRYSFTDSVLKARDWLVNKFHQFGYSDVSTPSFQFSGSFSGTGYNVKCVKRGYAEPDEIIVIGGHYDSYCADAPGPMVQAPGADDDGSGVTVTLEVARVLANVPLRKTVIFMPFSGEEQWMVGSSAAAQAFADSGAKIEAMFNYDMVGYTVSEPPEINLYSAPGTAYRAVAAQACSLLTPIKPVLISPTPGYDEGPFITHGAEGMLTIEYDFNSPNYHHITDLTSNMNFDYVTGVARMAAATIARVANAGAVLSIAKISVPGDGHTVRISASHPYPDYSYRLRYGLLSGSYTGSVDFAPGLDSVTVTGLTEGSRYYFAVFGRPPAGTFSIGAREISEVLSVAPHGPRGLTAEAAGTAIHLDWLDNYEEDLAGYAVYRRLVGQPDFELVQDNLHESQFDDSTANPDIKYEYAVKATDLDGHEGPYSQSAISCRPSFSAGIGVIDEMSALFALPPEDQQHAFFDSLFGPGQATVVRADSVGARIGKCDVGPFSSLFYFDDDVSPKQLPDQLDTLRWYLEHPQNFFLSAFRSLPTWVNHPIPADYFLATEFHLTNYDYAQSDAAVKVKGVNGWPSVQLDPTRGLAELLGIATLSALPDATVIYTYDSPTNNPRFAGKPCGVLYDTGHGKRIFLSFPLYYLTRTSSAAVIAKAKQYFGLTPSGGGPGDIDASGAVDLQDLGMLVAYLKGEIIVLPNSQGADVNGSCFINLSDLTLLVNYLILGLPDPAAGCATY